MQVKLRHARRQAQLHARDRSRTATKLWLGRARDLDTAITQRTKQLLTLETHIDTLLQADLNKTMVTLLRDLANHIESSLPAGNDAVAEVDTIVDYMDDMGERVREVALRLAEGPPRSSNEVDDLLLEQEVNQYLTAAIVDDDDNDNEVVADQAVETPATAAAAETTSATTSDIQARMAALVANDIAAQRRKRGVMLPSS